MVVGVSVRPLTGDLVQDEPEQVSLDRSQGRDRARELLALRRAGPTTITTPSATVLRTTASVTGKTGGAFSAARSAGVQSHVAASVRSGRSTTWSA